MSCKGFLLSLRQEILLQPLTVQMHSPLLWRRFASLLILWEVSLKLTLFIARGFHADQHPWDSPVSPGMLRCCGMVLPLLRHSRAGS